MADAPFASELSNLVLQKRRRSGELQAPELNQANRRRQPVLSAPVTVDVVPQQFHRDTAVQLDQVGHE